MQFSRMPDNFTRQRDRLVNHELRNLGIHDEAVLHAMLTVPREQFVPEHYRASAYGNYPLPIGEGQTISQPLMVAEMLEWLELKPTDRVLEIGTGSGYGAAILSLLAKEVFTIERHPTLAESARQVLEKLNCSNVHVLVGDGSLGWPPHAPFNAIVATAGAPKVPPPLLEQLEIGGRLVIPVGESCEIQEMVRVRREGIDEFQWEELGGACFVPLIGKAGWHPAEYNHGNT